MNYTDILTEVIKQLENQEDSTVFDIMNRVRLQNVRYLDRLYGYSLQYMDNLEVDKLRNEMSEGMNKVVKELIQHKTYSLPKEVATKSTYDVQEHIGSVIDKMEGIGYIKKQEVKKSKIVVDITGGIFGKPTNTLQELYSVLYSMTKKENNGEYILNIIVKFFREDDQLLVQLSDMDMKYKRKDGKIESYFTYISQEGKVVTPTSPLIIQDVLQGKQVVEEQLGELGTGRTDTFKEMYTYFINYIDQELKNDRQENRK